jgi:RNA polymerase sigma-70 factor (ECF subfamily)
LADDFLSRLKLGERAAFNEVVREHHGALFRMLQRILGNDADAQEVAQEAFLAAYQGIGGYEGRSSVKTWLISIGYRRAMDHLRRKHGDPWLLEGDLTTSPAWESLKLVVAVTEWTASPEDTYQRLEIREAMNALLAKVPAASRAVFELRDVQGFTVEETAQALTMTDGAVRVRLHRIRQYLAAGLQQRFGREGSK